MPSSNSPGPHVTTVPATAEAKPSAAESKPLEAKAPESKPDDDNVPEPVEPEQPKAEGKSFKEALVDGDRPGHELKDNGVEVGDSDSTERSSETSSDDKDDSTNTSRSNSNANANSSKDTEKEEGSKPKTKKETKDLGKEDNKEDSKEDSRVDKHQVQKEDQDKEKDTESDIPVTSPHCAVTSKRLPAKNTDEKAGVARTNVVEGDTSEGSMKEFHEFTPMQQHVLFWDRDRDGQIYPSDTYRGFRDLGFNILFSLAAVLIINLNFSYPTRLAHSFLPDPRFRVYVDSIYKAKHGSDSGTFDAEGRFVPQAFEDMFSKYDGDKDGALTFSELFGMMHGNRCAVDPFGWGAAFFEWATTWLLIQKDGKVYKDDLLGVYDGSLFWKIAKARKSGEGWSQGFGLGGDNFLGGVKVF
ncbi:uncharacterized protein DSM5745_07930 [Aspergillus mulundensis]|uniref:EF-hand domain-containing protein n=1 Tax=Aspergillus mulundensis TaxID=1810919 RepID=A0A3D8RFP1_9EURO|nr:hypothetical protein DSM5745_07930 [Aspergillus mulundensis]RDW72758.1 hypothetical protein DSM5745_07930 [Aspergillus mulundensis]